MSQQQPTETPSSLAAAVCQVMQEVTHVQKTGRNGFHKYTYASDADLLAALQPAMSKAGLCLLPVLVTPTTVEHASDRKGKTQYRTDLVVTYRLQHVSGESIDLQAPGCGIDGEDKGAYKAMTGALKYVLRHTFLVPTGDDPERDQGERRADRESSSQQALRPPQRPQQPQQGQAPAAPPKPPAPTGPQTWSEGDAAAFNDAIKAAGWSYQDVCDAIQVRSIEGHRPSEMTLEQRQSAFRWLQSEAGQEALVEAIEKRAQILDAYKAIPRGERAAIAEGLGIEHKAPSAQRTDRMARIVDAHAAGADLAQGGES